MEIEVKKIEDKRIEVFDLNTCNWKICSKLIFIHMKIS